MAPAKVFARRVMVLLAIAGFGTLASGAAYSAAGAALTLGTYASGR